MKAYIKDDFKNLLEYQEWVNKEMSQLTNGNKWFNEYFSQYEAEARIESTPEWHGEGVTYKELASRITEYKSPELITRIYNQVSHTLSLNTKDTIKAPKMQYNQLGLGMFSFERAAMGMFRLEEFFSVAKNTLVERENVNFRTIPLSLKEDGTEVIRRWEQKDDGKPKIRTTSKNVYAYFPKVRKENFAVDLFIYDGSNASHTAESLLYAGIPAIVIAQLLEKARIKTRISVLLGASPDAYKRSFYGVMLPVKNYDESLDTNLLALQTSDPRFLRWDAFKGLCAAYNHFNSEMPRSLGRALTKEYMARVIENSDYLDSRAIPENRFYLGSTFSEAQAIAEINDVIGTLSERINGK